MRSVTPSPHDIPPTSSTGKIDSMCVGVGTTWNACFRAPTLPPFGTDFLTLRIPISFPERRGYDGHFDYPWPLGAHTTYLAQVSPLHTPFVFTIAWNACFRAPTLPPFGTDFRTLRIPIPFPERRDYGGHFDYPWLHGCTYYISCTGVTTTHSFRAHNNAATWKKVYTALHLLYSVPLSRAQCHRKIQNFLFGQFLS